MKLLSRGPELVMSALISLTPCSRQCNLMLTSALVVVVVLVVLGTLVVVGVVVVLVVLGTLDYNCSTSLLIFCILLSMSAKVLAID